MVVCKNAKPERCSGCGVDGRCVHLKEAAATLGWCDIDPEMAQQREFPADFEKCVQRYRTFSILLIMQDRTNKATIRGSESWQCLTKVLDSN